MLRCFLGRLRRLLQGLRSLTQLLLGEILQLIGLCRFARFFRRFLKGLLGVVQLLAGLSLCVFRVLLDVLDVLLSQFLCRIGKPLSQVIRNFTTSFLGHFLGGLGGLLGIFLCLVGCLFFVERHGIPRGFSSLLGGLGEFLSSFLEWLGGILQVLIVVGS